MPAYVPPTEDEILADEYMDRAHARADALADDAAPPVCFHCKRREPDGEDDGLCTACRDACPGCGAEDTEVYFDPNGEADCCLACSAPCTVCGEPAYDWPGRNGVGECVHDACVNLCDSCGEAADELHEVDDSDPTVGVVNHLDVCTTCLRRGGPPVRVSPLATGGDPDIPF